MFQASTVMSTIPYSQATASIDALQDDIDDEDFNWDKILWFNEFYVCTNHSTTSVQQMVQPWCNKWCNLGATNGATLVQTANIAKLELLYCCV